MNPFYWLYRWVIFKVGDIRRLKSFPKLTWDVTYPEICGYERHKMAQMLQVGDVILSRHDGYLSNLGIGGAMIHGAIYVGDGSCVEAVSEGVIKSSAYDALHADKVVIMRAKGLSPKVRKEIADRALSIVGFEYDVLFDFNTEEEKEKILDNKELAKKSVRFACTEVPFYAYNGWAKHLRIERKPNPSILAKLLVWVGLHVGDRIIKADDYIESDMEIVYVSKGATFMWFRSKGSSNQVLHKISKYWQSVL